MRTTLGLTLITLVLAACGGGVGDPGGDGTDGTDGPSAARAPVGDWVLVAADPPISIPEGARATLTVTEDGSANGDTPCNGYGGTAVWEDDGDWALDELSVTEMGCEPDRMAAQESFLDTLVAATAWAVPDEDTLELTSADSSLTFSRLAPVDAAALVGTDWVLTGFVEGDAVSTPAGDVEDPRLRLDGDETGGTFTLFTGCRDFAGEWVTAGDTIELPSWGQADGSRDAEDCSEAELESESLVLGAVESSFRATVDDRSLELRAAADDAYGLLFGIGEEDPAPRSSDEEAREICEAVMAMSQDGDGFPTREAALESFIDGDSGWWTPPGPGFSLEGASIMLDGERVGEVYLFQFRNGTWAVSGYEVCYPADLASD